jgi:hypothetical protein
MQADFYAGLDYTATPSAHEPQPYGPCIVTVPDEAAFEVAWRQIFVAHGISADEIKGHNSSEDVLLESLRTIRTTNAQIGLLLLDKTRILSGTSTLPAPARLRLEMGCTLVKIVLELQPIGRLLCDEEFKGRAEQAAFRTAILRIKRRVQSESKMKVGFRPSHKSTLIQAADVVAYIGSRYFRGAKLTHSLRREFETLRAENDDRIQLVDGWGGRESDLRP